MYVSESTIITLHLRARVHQAAFPAQGTKPPSCLVNSAKLLEAQVETVTAHTFKRLIYMPVIFRSSCKSTLQEINSTLSFNLFPNVTANDFISSSKLGIYFLSSLSLSLSNPSFSPFLVNSSFPLYPLNESVIKYGECRVLYKSNLYHIDVYSVLSCYDLNPDT